MCLSHITMSCEWIKTLYYFLMKSNSDYYFMIFPFLYVLLKIVTVPNLTFLHWCRDHERPSSPSRPRPPLPAGNLIIKGLSIIKKKPINPHSMKQHAFIPDISKIPPIELFGQGDHWHKVEKSYGKFWRQFRLPNNVDLDSVKAKLENGVLILTLDKFSPDKIKVPRVVVSIAGEVSRPSRACRSFELSMNHELLS